MKYRYSILLICILFSCSKEVIAPACLIDNSCSNTSIMVENTMVGKQEIVIIYSEALNFYQSFIRGEIDHTPLTFEVILNKFPIVMEDQLGNHYNVFGQVVEGPHIGQNLAPLNAGVGYWFVWSSIFPNINLEGVKGNGEAPSVDDPEWEVSTSFVNQGAASDAIPALTFPEYKSFTNKDIFTTAFLKDEDEIIVLNIGGQVKIYPIKILNYHEIVNDTMAGIPFAVCYAPYTHTSSVWNRNVNNVILEFGVSGRIYNNNILLFDRTSSSLWNQLLEKSVNGAYKGTSVERISYFRTTWSTWRETSNVHNILVGDIEAGFDYSIDPLGDYNLDHDYLPFNISNYDGRLSSKDRVYGIEVDGEAIAYRF